MGITSNKLATTKIANAVLPWESIDSDPSQTGRVRDDRGVSRPNNRSRWMVHEMGRDKFFDGAVIVLCQLGFLSVPLRWRLWRIAKPGSMRSFSHRNLSQPSTLHLAHCCFLPIHGFAEMTNKASHFCIGRSETHQWLKRLPKQIKASSGTNCDVKGEGRTRTSMAGGGKHDLYGNWLTASPASVLFHGRGFGGGNQCATDIRYALDIRCGLRWFWAANCAVNWGVV